MGKTLILLFAAGAGLAVCGEPQWMAPFPQHRDLTSTDDGISNYVALAPSAQVISYYEQRMREAGAEFKAQNDGIGVSIVWKDGKESAVLQVREIDGVTTVRTSYAVTPDPPPAPVQVAAAPVAQPQRQALAPTPVAAAPAPAAAPKAAPKSPNTKSEYKWVLKSTRVTGAVPAKYHGTYLDAATETTAAKALSLPKGATVVDVSPMDCTFNMEDTAKHFLTYRKGDKALGADLMPGTWSVFPMRCTSISVYLN